MIRKANEYDSKILAQMASIIWDNDNVNELEEEFRENIKSDKEACFIKFIDGKAVGFADVALRYDYVEGTETSPVGYLEGIFVEEDYRFKGFGSDLVIASQDWAKEKGAREFASDCILENTVSIIFHKALGFEEANRIVCFRKDL